MPNDKGLSDTRAQPESYFWHTETWSRLTRELNKLAHALLLDGLPGLGKAAFAARLAQTLLCAHPGAQAEACGRCKSCQLFMAGNHPDLLRIEPAEEGKAIVVDQVRALVDFLALRPHTAERKVVVISPAEAMNLNAANSLLKSLEEPPLGSIILLVSNQAGRLPATVRSRCSRITFSPPGRAQAMAWLVSRVGTDGEAELLLDLAGGTPLRALALAQTNYLTERAQLLQDVEALHSHRDDPITCAARWGKLGADRSLAWLHGFVCDLIKVGMTDSRTVTLANPDVVASLDKLNKYININKLYYFLDAVTEARKLVSTPLDKILLLEDVLIQWSRLTR